MSLAPYTETHKILKLNLLFGICKGWMNKFEITSIDMDQEENMLNNLKTSEIIEMFYPAVTALPWKMFMKNSSTNFSRRKSFLFVALLIF